ncbi:Sensor histidine kinase LiaS [Frondihabitans sp. 762G35]|uniref:sensor histidine kinase n=1 Tax=Frondihabitans sp. 762G35 TaxID=1446794 RepID=UPI000D21820B|nr:ATP-binding protein [Frondihabitans sp. 762G35]ARC57529.1 Sensor histidine kinase LiaS [Frondihabitans sp. 762G35]
MLLGLPSHLAPQSSGRAIARACHAIAFVLLASAAAIVITAQSADPRLMLWPALVALVPMLALLLLVDRVRSTVSTVAYLVVGALAVYVFALTVLSQVTFINSSDAFTMSLPKLALVLVGGSGLASRKGPLWATFGLVAGEVAIQVATAQAGASPRVDLTTLFGYLLVVGTMGGSILARDRARRVQPNLHRAARDEQVSNLRFEIEQQASALVHDTVLSHLAAIGLARPGRLDPALLDAMQRDLASLIGQEWLSEVDADLTQVAGHWESSELFVAIEQSRRQGLDVQVTGDLSVVSRLDVGRSRALGQAVGQCLANVVKHAGTDSAEVVLFSSEGDVSVMVIDSGVGFTESETPSDRLGLRNSVRARIERAGGTVQVWSSPGSGTSVMIGLPALADAPSSGALTSEDAA